MSLRYGFRTFLLEVLMIAVALACSPKLLIDIPSRARDFAGRTQRESSWRNAGSVIWR